ncbi:hypothetical protein GCM10025867_39210 [Frondihabitans sucicola]|uniref:Cell envelope-related transcriptional attenuator domain-containing protein n=1 Tax=Frondihabitans sucicola TaxID=1268041 RepID=A0ABN6Y6R9_9MICO|nr:LCP family protein [Frondihabitans sucicola]BDZ51680.1 hypothetical protein GCM10025867_39210 [Frondihabitans sucicola]
MRSAITGERRTASRQRRRRGRRFRAAGIALGVVVLLIGGIVGGGALLLHNIVGRNLTTLPAADVFPAEKGRPAPSTGAKNILLLGSDSRQKTADHDLESAGSQRADTMMLVHVAADRSHVSVMSVMRDLYVPVPGHGTAKINSSLAWGGTPWRSRPSKTSSAPGSITWQSSTSQGCQT